LPYPGKRGSGDQVDRADGPVTRGDLAHHPRRLTGARAGSERGGTIYDLASLLDHGAWGRSLRGEAFTVVRRRVHETLAPDG
jgi:hypothetical protein